MCGGFVRFHLRLVLRIRFCSGVAGCTTKGSCSSFGCFFRIFLRSVESLPVIQRFVVSSRGRSFVPEKFILRLLPCFVRCAIGCCSDSRWIENTRNQPFARRQPSESATHSAPDTLSNGRSVGCVVK